MQAHQFILGAAEAIAFHCKNLDHHLPLGS
jgi:hypothetical protein